MICDSLNIFGPYWIGIFHFERKMRHGKKDMVMLRSGLMFGLLLAATPGIAAEVISANYEVSLGGTRIMKADYTATLDDDSYSANLSAKTVGVSKVFSKIRMNLSVKGSLSEAGLKPASYAYYRKKNDNKRERNLSFSSDGSLITDGADYGATITAALNNKVMDPLSMLLKLGRSTKPCSGKHRAFDGRDVFDVSLSGNGKSGGTLTCKLVYTPVAGNEVDEGDTSPQTYEITLVPYGDQGAHMPVKFSGSSKGIGFEASATSVSVNGTPLSY